METGIVKLNPEMLALLSQSGQGGIMPFRREIFVLNEYLSGVNYCKSMPEIFPLLQKDTPLTLMRDIDNEYDPCAIGVYYDTTRIGWVPMKDNIVMARLMDAGKAFTCKVVDTKRHGTWYNIDVNYFMIDQF